MNSPCDVLVIGGGLTGALTAYGLAGEGVDVLLVEQFELNTQASGSNAGSIHAQIAHEPFVQNGEEWAKIYAPAIPLLMASIRLWAALQEDVGPDLGLHLTGGLLVAETESHMRDIERKAAIERAHGLPIAILDRAALRDMAPYVSDKMIGGSFCPIEGKANSLLATTRIVQAAVGRGARIRTGVRVCALEKVNGAFSVDTTIGTIRARRVVNCAGAAAGDVAKMVGIALPIEGHPIQVTVTERVSPIVRHLVYFAGGKLSLKQAANGSLLIGGGWPSTQDPVTGELFADLRSLSANLAVALRVVPDLRDVLVLRTWPAIVNGTADWRPVIGEIPGTPGFYIAMFPWMGFTAAPIAARLVTQLILGRKPDFDLKAIAAAGA